MPLRRLCLVLFIFSTAAAYGQKVRKTFQGLEFDSAYYDSLCRIYAYNKCLPKGFEKQTLQALTYFPELKDVRIRFRIKQKSSPLMVRPSIGSTLFRSPPRRTYIIFISSHSSDVDSIIMKHLPLDAQIGVLGHELSHVSFFIQQGMFGMLRVAIGTLSWRYIDRIEFETDRSTIHHGLGYQLLVWSDFVRIKLKMDRWRGADDFVLGKAKRPKERYMNPETIRAVMASSDLYQQ